MTLFLAMAALAASAAAEAPTPAPPFHLVRGTFVAGRGPDGNSIFLDAPDGLILVDTGRHPAHRDKLLAYAKERGRPIAAIVNTHWHFDHTTSNGEILTAHPSADIIASTAVDGDLFKSFNANSRKGAEDYLASGQATEAQEAEIRRAFAVMDNLQPLRPTRPVTADGDRAIAGRTMSVRLAPYAASEGDVWLYAADAGLAIVGDLVVGPIPFMDTACIDGWKAALEKVAATPWTTLIPGHGAIMNRAQFDGWRAAFNSLVDCGYSTAPVRDCARGWTGDAAAFIDPGDEQRIAGMAAYYVETRLRSADGRAEFCRKAGGKA